MSVCIANAQTVSYTQRLANGLDSLIRIADNRNFTTGICVWDLTADTLVYQYNQYKSLRPASTQKLLSAITALDVYGGDSEYTTEVCYTGELYNDTLHGNIYIVGGFDPSLTESDISHIADTIMGLGIRHITGLVCGDISMKDSVMLGWGWCWDDEDAYLSPLTFNRGRGSDGKYSPTPHLYFTTNLISQLSDRGITLNDAAYTVAERPDSYTPVCCLRNKTSDILVHTMKKSDNFYAESLFYRIANKIKGKYADAPTARKAITSVIEKAGGNTAFVKVADGSGVSLYNYVTAQAEVALLRYAYKNYDSIYKYLYPSLPVSGIDGTLSSRMTSGPAFGKIHAKTGTVTGVTALAGYTVAPDGTLLAFSIINNGVMSSSIGRNFENMIMDFIHK